MEVLNSIDFFSDEKVIDLLETKDHLSLAKFLGKELCDFNENDEMFIDMFWDAAFNKSWLYVSEEMVNEQFGYKKSKDMMLDFYDKLQKEFEKDIDYKTVNKDHILVNFYSGNFPSKKSAHNKQYYIITGETYKSLLQSAQTKQGKLTRKYFIKIEKLANLTNQAIYKYIEYNKNQQIEESKQKLDESRLQITKLEKRQIKLESFVKNIKQLEKNQLFYLATSSHYAVNNRFEYGGVKDVKELKSRFATYNTGRAEGDLMYVAKLFKCHNYKNIEERIGTVLMQFKDKPNSRKEMIHLRYNLLVEITDFICDNYDREVEYINAHCQRYLAETIESDGFIPEMINLDEYMQDYLQLTVRRNGQEQTNKIDISNWDDVKINQTIEEVINLCASEKKQVQYEFSTQKNLVDLELSWAIINTVFKPR